MQRDERPVRGATARGRRRRARAWARKVVALTIPSRPGPRMSFLSGFVLDALAGWAKPMSLPAAEKLGAVRRPRSPPRARAQAEGTQGLIRAIANWERLVFLETFAPENAGYAGRAIGEVATERGQTPFDALCDIAVADDLRTVFSTPEFGNDRADWDARVAVWRDGRAVIGASDAGAHLDLLATFNYTTDHARRGGARARSASRSKKPCSCSPTCPPRLYGLRDRGRIAPGRSPTSWCSIRRRSARARSSPAPTCRPARRALRRSRRDRRGDRQRRGDRASTASSPTRVRARCCAPVATPRRLRSTTPKLQRLRGGSGTRSARRRRECARCARR